MERPSAMPDDDLRVPDPSRFFPSERGEVELFGFTEIVRVGEPEPMPRAHRHLDIEVNVLLAGGMTYSLGGRRIEVGAGRLFAFWAATPHSLLAVAPGSRCVWVTLPLARVARWELPRGGLDRLLAGATLEGEAPPAELAERWPEDAASGDAARRRAMGLEIHAALLRARCADETLPAGEDAVARMCRFVGENLGRPLAVAQIAGAAGYHPTAAMRLFRRETGMTLGGYVAAQRLAGAQRLLMTTALPVEAVAARCGYGSVSRFHAVFRAATGTTPGGFRGKGHL